MRCCARPAGSRPWPGPRESWRPGWRIAGGAIGLSGVFRGYPTAAFFAVSVLVANYHIFSEWLSLLVKTRSSQAVKKLLDLQPDLARVVRDGAEVEVPAEQVAAGDRVRIRPGERILVDGQIIEGYSTVDLSLVTDEPIQDARALKPGVLHLVDRVLRVYTPAVLTISALALVGWLVGSWAAGGGR